MTQDIRLSHYKTTGMGQAFVTQQVVAIEAAIISVEITPMDSCLVSNYSI
jgi:hypothetical protein